MQEFSKPFYATFDVFQRPKSLENEKLERNY